MKKPSPPLSYPRRVPDHIGARVCRNIGLACRETHEELAEALFVELITAVLGAGPETVRRAH